MLRSLLLLAIMATTLFTSLFGQSINHQFIAFGEPTGIDVNQLLPGGNGYFLTEGDLFGEGNLLVRNSNESIQPLTGDLSDSPLTQYTSGDQYTLVDIFGAAVVLNGLTGANTRITPENYVNETYLRTAVYYAGKFYAMRNGDVESELVMIDPETGVITNVAFFGERAGGFVTHLELYNNQLIFVARSEDNTNVGVWTSDGTIEGTLMLTTLPTEFDGDLAVLDGTVLINQYEAIYTLEADNSLLLREMIVNPADDNLFDGVYPIGSGSNQGWLACSDLGECYRFNAATFANTDVIPLNFFGQLIPTDNGDLVYYIESGNGYNMMVLDGATNQEVTIFVDDLYIFELEQFRSNYAPFQHLNGLTYFIAEINFNDRFLYAYDHLEGELLTVEPPTAESENPSTPLVKNGVLYVAYEEGDNEQFYSYGTNLEPSLTGNVYYDQNNNGQRDPNESGIANVRITANSTNNAYAFTDTSGNYVIYLSENETYEILPEDLDCRQLTSSPSDTEVVYDGSLITGYNFGFGNATENNPSLSASISSAAPRCGFEVPFWVNMTNDGCKSHPAELQLTLPDNVTLVSATPVPVQTGNTLTWNYVEQLIPGDGEQVLLILRMPGEDFVDELIELTAVAVVPTSTTISDTFHYNQPLRCAIDPNDKQVSPARQEPSNSNYTRFDETLTYTIRFQNTGNDTAFTVRIEDQLSNDLDWETFRPLSGSHSFQATLSESGMAQFLFEDILLPDSIVNEPASHGYVVFQIDFIEAIAEGTVVPNTVGIFFDFNRPVITNTVINTAVEFLDQDQDGFFFWDECDDENENINPDAPDLTMNGIDENCDDEDGVSGVNNYLPGDLEIFPNPTTDRLTLIYSLPTQLRAHLYDLHGRKLLEINVTDTAQFDLSQVPAGAYLLRITDAQSGRSTVRKVFKASQE